MKKLIYLFTFILASSQMTIAQSNSVAFFGDTLLWIPSFANMYVNPADSADYDLQSYDEDGLTNFPGGLTGTAIDEYISTSANDIDPQQGDTDSAYYWAGTSFFLNPGQADNWLIFGPITIPNAGVDIRWRFRHPDANFRDAYSFYVDTVGNTPADFTGSPIYMVGDNASSTGGPTAGSWRNAPLQNLAGPTWRGKKVYFAFRHTGNNQNAIYLDNIRVQEAFNTGIAGNTDNEITVGSSAPNPFVSTTSINISLNKSFEKISITVFDLQGRRMMTKELDDLVFGKNTIELDGTKWESGTYYFRVDADGSSVVGKMLKL